MEFQPLLDAVADFVQKGLLILLPGLASAAVVWVKLELDKRKLLWVLKRYAPMVVQEAERLGYLGKINDKKAYAVGLLQKALNQYGLGKVDSELVSLEIEAAVIQEFNWQELLPEDLPVEA